MDIAVAVSSDIHLHSKYVFVVNVLMYCLVMSFDVSYNGYDDLIIIGIH